MLKQIILKQITKSVLCLLAVASATLILSPVASAQLPPPISPWMGMFERPHNPTLGNYLGTVRPQQNLMRATSAHANQLQAQQLALQALQMQGGGFGGGTGIRALADAAGLAPTGGALTPRDVLAPPREIPSIQRHPAGFNQYLHFYPSHSMPRRPVPNFSTPGRRW